MNKKENKNLYQNSKNKKYKNKNNNMTTIAGCDTIEINLVSKILLEIFKGVSRKFQV